MMVIALELPHLDVDLADNRWQCDYSVAAFQNVISESWRETWNGICSKSVGKSLAPLLSEMFPAELGKAHEKCSLIGNHDSPPESESVDEGIKSATGCYHHWYRTLTLSS